MLKYTWLEWIFHFPAALSPVIGNKQVEFVNTLLASSLSCRVRTSATVLRSWSPRQPGMWREGRAVLPLLFYVKEVFDSSEETSSNLHIPSEIVKNTDFSPGLQDETMASGMLQLGAPSRARSSTLGHVLGTVALIDPPRLQVH